MEVDNRVLVVRRMHVTYHLRVAPDKREAAIRAHSVHAGSCPMARTLQGCVAITTSLDLLDVDDLETAPAGEG